MARGWESKSVEDQVQDFQAKTPEEQSSNVTEDKTENSRRRKVLILARARVESELQLDLNPRYREQLIRALADLDAQLAKLPGSSTKS
jgi:hypothetical protein